MTTRYPVPILQSISASLLLVVLLGLSSLSSAQCGAGDGPPNCDESTDAGSTQRNTPSSGGGDPINLITGNNYQRQIDHQPRLGDLSQQLAFLRHYSSANTMVNYGLGPGWSSTWHVQLSWTAETEYQLIQSDGRRIVFTADKTTAATAGEDRFDAIHPGDGYLIKTEESIRWQLTDGRVFTFSADKKKQLQRIDHPGGRYHTLSYEDNRLTQVEDSRGLILALHYYGEPGLANFDSDLSKAEQVRRDAKARARAGQLKRLELPDGDSIHYRYDTKGNLIQVRYPDGRRRQYLYANDAYPHALTGINDSQGKSVGRWGYDDTGRANHYARTGDINRIDLVYDLPTTAGGTGTTTLTNSLGEQSTYIWQHAIHNNQPLLLETSGPGCGTCPESNVRYEYSERGEVLAIYRAGGSTHYTYDEQGRTVEITYRSDAGGEQWLARYEYSGDSHHTPSATIRPSINPDGEHRTDITYNAERLPTKITESGWSPAAKDQFKALQRETRLSYNDKGRLTAIDGPRRDVADITQLRYTDAGDLKTITTPDGQVQRVLNYDANGRITALQSGDQSPLRIRYTPAGKPAEIGRGEQTVKYTYDDTGNLTLITDPSGQQTRIVYDEGDRITRISRDNGPSMALAFNDESQVTERQVSNSQGTVLDTVTYLYDANNRLNTLTRQQNSNAARSTEYDYNDVGELTQITGPDDQTTELTHSPLGQLLQISQPGQVNTILHQDALGRPAGITDAEGNTTRQAKDDFGRVVSIASAATGATVYQYDAASNPTQKRTASGATIKRKYDAANRLIQETTPDGVTRQQYDPVTGRLASLSSAAGNERYQYDQEARLIAHTRELDGHTFTTRYAYNGRDQITQKTLPDGQVLNYHYYQKGPQKGQLRALTKDNWFGLSQTELLTELDGNRWDGQTQINFGNGLSTTYEYDDQGQLSQIDTNKTFSLKYTYDAKGNISGIDSNDSASQYRYDTFNRLSQATTNKQRYQYDYDKVGNRTAAKTHEVTQQLAYAKKQGNRLAEINNQGLEYNAEGSPTLTPGPQGTRKYVYNAEQRPVKLYIDGQLTAEYAYNGFGERVKKVVYSHGKDKDQSKGIATYYLYDGRSLVAEADGSGNIIRQYVYHQNTPAIMLEGSEPYYLHTDHLGTPRLATDEDQQTVWQASYTPFGEAEITTQEVTLNLRFPGQYEDQESGTYYNYFRDYDPETGRYLTSDPIGLKGGINSYAYVGGNPLSYGDPLGLFTLQNARDDLAARNEPMEGLRDGLQGPSRYYTDEQVFGAWLRLERSDTNWLDELEDRHCPVSIELNTANYSDGRGGCIAVTRAVNPDASKWVDPHDGISLQVFHPGGTWEMRSQPTPGGYTNQCIYDENGNIMRNFSSRFGTAGTADFNGGGNGSHYDHDVAPFFLAQWLGKVPEYYGVRPILVEGDP